MAILGGFDEPFFTPASRGDTGFVATAGRIRI
jgi:hypothetical protein